jgi:hypothetical protein
VEGKQGAKVSIIIPALIDKSQHAASMVQGLKLRDGSTVFKSVECRGSRCFTSYRGAVAIFASKAYNSERGMDFVIGNSQTCNLSKSLKHSYNPVLERNGNLLLE